MTTPLVRNATKSVRPSTQRLRVVAACAGVALLASMYAAQPVSAQKLLATTASLTTTAALQAAQAALVRCQKDGYTVAVAVVDRAGQPLALLRDDLAGNHTPQTAIGKAATAVTFRIDTAELATSTEPGKPQSGIRTLPGVVAIAGGIVMRAKGGVVGGIGVSGAPGGDADAVCAKAGFAAVSDALELE